MDQTSVEHKPLEGPLKPLGLWIMAVYNLLLTKFILQINGKFFI